MKKILLLGSGELGKEFVIACQRLGQYVIAVDSYDHAPAMQVAHEKEVINMLDGDSLDSLVEKHQFELKLKIPIQARYIKIKAENYGKCPDWHLGSGGTSWLFFDEITIL